MNTRQILFIVCAAALVGCSTPASRIKKNPALFNSFPPEVQTKVSNGQVDVGFTKDMVAMALGRADRTYTRKTAAGSSEVWAYTSFYVTTERQRVRADVRARDLDGRYRTIVDDIWVDVDQHHEYDRLRVEFDNDGKVSAVETSDR